MPKNRSLEKKFPYDFKISNDIITHLLLKRNIIIHKKKFFENDWIFINHGSFCRGKYSLQIYGFQFEKTVKNLHIFYFKTIAFEEIVYFKEIVLTNSATENFAFKIGNSRVVENISSEKITHDL